MKQEIKICLPAYKIAYSLCFTVLLSLVRGISSISEIGVTLDSYMPMLAIVFCADTYQAEYSGKRWEVFRLYSIQKRKKAVLTRLVMQCIYLWLLSILGYICFFWQNPFNIEEIPGSLLFGTFIGSVIVSIALWGCAAMTFANIFRNTWAGIGSSMVLWLAFNSKKGDEMLHNWNVCSFTFRDINNPADWSWLYGKAAAGIAIILMAASISQIIKKRG